MSLKLQNNEHQLRALMAKYSSNPLFYSIWHSIKFSLERKFPTRKLVLYSYQMGTSDLLIAFNENRITDDYVVFFCEGDLDNSCIRKAVAELLRLHPLENRVVYIGEERITKLVSNYLAEEDPSLNVTPYPCRLFYMNQRQMKLVEKVQIPLLPNGYELGSADPEKDAELITKTWRHSRANEIDQTRAKLFAFPSSCVYFKGSPVGFEMVDATGLLNHLFVLEEHRKKGLGYAIELDLARKMINNGNKVHKCVEFYNASVIDGTQRSPFWSTAKNADGSDLTYIFMVVAKG